MSLVPVETERLYPGCPSCLQPTRDPGRVCASCQFATEREQGFCGLVFALGMELGRAERERDELDAALHYQAEKAAEALAAKHTALAFGLCGYGASGRGLTCTMPHGHFGPHFGDIE